MSDDQISNPLPAQLKVLQQDLQLALLELRNELHRLSLNLQEYMLTNDDALMRSVRDEAAELLQRVQSKP